MNGQPVPTLAEDCARRVSLAVNGQPIPPLGKSGGEGGIRTHGRGLAYTHLAGVRLKPTRPPLLFDCATPRIRKSYQPHLASPFKGEGYFVCAQGSQLPSTVSNFGSSVTLAEGVGFEPTVLSYNGFQDRRLKPLGHPSIFRRVQRRTSAGQRDAGRRTAAGNLKPLNCAPRFSLALTC